MPLKSRLQASSICSISQLPNHISLRTANRKLVILYNINGTAVPGGPAWGSAGSCGPDRCRPIGADCPKPAKFSAFAIYLEALPRLRDFLKERCETNCDADLALLQGTVPIAQPAAGIGSESQGQPSVALLVSIDMVVVIQRVPAL